MIDFVNDLFTELRGRMLVISQFFRNREVPVSNIGPKTVYTVYSSLSFQASSEVVA